MIAPQFKTWFYVYRNVSSDETFRKMLMDNYLVEVKDIERLNDFDTFRTEDEKPTNSKDIAQFEDLKSSETFNGADVEGFETLKIADDEEIIETTDSVLKAIQDYDQLNQDAKNQVTKFDKHVDDEQYIDSPVIKKDAPKNEVDGPEKIVLPTKKYLEDSAEIMIAQENFRFESRVICRYFFY